MQIPVLRNKSGFTIVEFLISVLLLTVALFGLLTTLNLAMSTNMETKMRNDATMLADEYISRARTVDYASLNTITGVVTRDVLVGVATVRYTVDTKVAQIGGVDAKTSSVSVDVSWPVKGVVKHHMITTSVSDPNPS